MVRSYSRITGQTSEEAKTKRSGASLAISSFTAISCARFRQECRKETMMPAVPLAFAAATAVPTAAMSGASASLPSARRRAGIPKIMSLEMSWSGRVQNSE